MFDGGKSESLSYKSSGVDLDRAEKALKLIKDSVTSTFSRSVLSDLSSFCGLFELELKDYKNPVLTASTDGVGTKLLIAKEMNCFKYIGQDLVAMCVNDILCSGAKPLFFLDYIACGKIDPEKIRIIVDSISNSCKQCKTTLIGGETAEMPDMYKSDDIDIAGFVVGIVEKENVITKNLVRENDLLVGIPSSGIHSNGFSLVRKVIRDRNLDIRKVYRELGEKCLGEILLTPTRIYYGLVSRIIDNIRVHGIAHITGGGFYENIRRIIPEHLDVKIKRGSWEILPVFGFFQKMGNISDREMYRVFNMGIGMVIIVSPSDFHTLKEIAGKEGEKIYNIGTVVNGSGKVLIEGIDNNCFNIDV